jgi:protein-disulfide isomerase
VEEVFLGYVEELELDIDQYKEQVQSDETVDRVQAHYDSGVKSGVNSTPSFYLNGDKMEGYATLDDFKEIIVAAVNPTT